MRSARKLLYQGSRRNRYFIVALLSHNIFRITPIIIRKPWPSWKVTKLLITSFAICANTTSPSFDEIYPISKGRC
jgi:hypothetical protein